ncbi:MAG: hypothetical protein AAGJ08_12270, partial [Cyanobacteria bacterium P01_H01_bin.35]
RLHLAVEDHQQLAVDAASPGHVVEQVGASFLPRSCPAHATQTLFMSRFISRSESKTLTALLTLVDNSSSLFLCFNSILFFSLFQTKKN